MTAIRDIFEDPEATADGDLRAATGLDLAAQRILRVLFMQPGELLHRPRFGGGLGRFQNKPPTPGILNDLSRQVRQTLDTLSWVESHTHRIRHQAGQFTLEIAARVDGEQLVITETL